MLDFFLKWSGIKEAVVSIFLFLDAIVYSFISYVYQIFLVLAGSNSIVDDSFIDGFVERLYMIIGVVALFIIAYSLLKMMVNPDEGLKGKNSPTKIIFNIISSIVLVALIPTIFDFAYAVQNSFLTQNTIGRLILGPTTMSYNGTSMDSNTIFSQGGYLMSSSVFQAFLHPTAATPDYCQTIEEEANADEAGCQILMVDDNDWGLLNFLHGIPLFNTAANIIDEVVIENLLQLFTGSRGGTSYGTVQKTAEYNQSFFTYGIYSNAIVEGTVSYYPVISTAVGVFVLFVLISYAIDTALRVVKLSVFELIAPLPILARIVPNDQTKKVFDNWLKATLSTFAEVFIRLALLFFAVLMINTVVFSIDNLFSPIAQNWGSARWDILFIAQALVILGVILFVKQAPQIIKDITGLDSSKFKMFSNMKNAAAFVGGTAMGRSPLAGFRAMNETAKSGNLRSIGNQYKRRLAKEEAKKYGASFGSRTHDKLRSMMGMPTLKERYDTDLEKNINPETNKPFIATNQSGDAINLPGNVTIAAGGAVELNAENIRLINEQKALNEQRKAEIAETVRQYKDIDDRNKTYQKYEDDMKKIAKQEIAKNKYWIKSDANGNNLDLSYTTKDANGNTITISSSALGLHTQVELESWLDGAKDDMDPSEYAKLKATLQTAITKHTVDSYINSNGIDINGSGNAIDTNLTHIKDMAAASLINNNGLFTIDAQTGQTTSYTTQQIANLINDLNNNIRQASDLTKDEITMLSDLGSKDLSYDISLQIQSQERFKSRIDENNAQLDRILDQGKKQAEVFKASESYIQADASNKAINTENSGKK